MRMCEGVEVQLHASQLQHHMELIGELHAPSPSITHKKAISINGIEGCVGPASGLDPMQIKKNLSLSLVAHLCQHINSAIMILYFNILYGFISLIWVYNAPTYASY
jgi:hypothetical protein